MITNRRRQGYLNRKHRIRKRLHGTHERPRMSVFRTARHIYVQVIDDEDGKTLIAASSAEKDIRDKIKGKKKADSAALVGEVIATRCLAKEILKVVFDRNGFIYHGRIAKLADAARKKGLSL